MANAKKCAVFWDNGWSFCELPHEGKQPVGPYESLDGVITAAKAAGFTIDRVQATRGLLPEPGPKDKGVLDGDRVA